MVSFIHLECAPFGMSCKYIKRILSRNGARSRAFLPPHAKNHAGLRPRKRPEKGRKHILFFDKVTRCVCAHMEATDDPEVIKRIQEEHNKMENSVGCRVLRSRKFQLPRAGNFADAFMDETIPEDLTVDDIDSDTGNIRGKYATDGALQVRE